MVFLAMILPLLRQEKELIVQSSIRRGLRAPKGCFRSVPVAGNCNQQSKFKIIK